MHPLDIPTAESGGPFRPMRPAPGLLGQVLCRLFFDPDERMEPVAICSPLYPIVRADSTTITSATKAVAASSATLPLVTAQIVAFERGVGGRVSRKELGPLTIASDGCAAPAEEDNVVY
jgi:hypothetical protein